jgi:hypothetical protein
MPAYGRHPRRRQTEEDGCAEVARRRATFPAALKSPRAPFLQDERQLFLFNVFAAPGTAADHFRRNHCAAIDSSRMIVSSRSEPVETTAAGTPVNSSRRAM